MRLRVAALLLGLLAIAVVATGCGGSDTASAETAAGGSGITLVSPEEAAQLIADDDEIEVIDVRTPDEYADGHLEGATLVDFYSPDFADRIAELDRDGRYVVYCRSGNRSGQATAMMADQGFASVADVDGGIVAWQAAGLETIR